jgi:hypothetical protein
MRQFDARHVAQQVVDNHQLERLLVKGCGTHRAEGCPAGPPVIRLTGRCLTKPSALDGRCTQMVTLQIAEPFCPRDRLVGGALHPFGHGNAAESADPTEQIPQKNAPFVAI